MMSCASSQVLVDVDGCSVVVNERTTVRLTMRLVDEAGAKIPIASVDTVTLSLYARDVAGQPEIAGTVTTPRNVKNVNGGTLGETASETTLAVVLTPADAAIVDTTKNADPTYQEWHVVQLNIGYGGTKELHQLIEFPVRNLTKVV